VGAPVDSILAIVVQQAADELRLGTGRAPRMFARGTPKKLSIPETSDEMVRHLLGPLLDEEREASLRASGRVEFPYDAGALGAFHLALTARAEGGVDAVFTRVGAPRTRAPAQADAPATVAGHPYAPAVPSGYAPTLAFAPGAAPAHYSPATLLTPAAPLPPEPMAGADLAGLLARAVAYRASDVHLLTGEPPTMRVDGRLRQMEGEPTADVEALLRDVLGADARARLDSRRSVDVAIDVEGAGRFRVNVYRASQGTAAAIRLLAQAAPLLSSLSLPVALDDLAELPHGLVILCGPTGSGKSTTLAALAQETLRRRGALVLSLEDPIEYVLSPHGGLVRQRQVGRDVSDFAQGLRDALREDPDVLLIGEMRDPETISLALTAAETGHLVLTSLHSRSAASAVERIVDAYPPGRQDQVRGQLGDALRAVVSQRLIPRRGGGRAVALEVMRGTHAVSAIVREGRVSQLASAIQSSKKEGMLALEKSLADLVRSGQVTDAAARAVVNDVATFDTYLGVSR
jgi:twitching motility protein PilT